MRVFVGESERDSQRVKKRERKKDIDEFSIHIKREKIQVTLLQLILTQGPKE